MFGIDYLAGAKYAETVLDEHPNGWAAGFFANTFGDAFPLITRLLSTGRCPRVRIHAAWADDHRFKPEIHRKIIKQEALRAMALKSQFHQVDVQFSPFCELSGSREEAQAVIEIAASALSGSAVTMVSSTLQGYRVPGAITEIHGSKMKVPSPTIGFNFSFDGEDAFGSDVEHVKAKYTDASTFFFWSPHLNLKPKLDDKTPREKRRYRPQGKHIDALIALSRSSGACSLPKGWTLKPMSEDTGDSKSNKVVVIAPIDIPQLKLRDLKSNQVMDTLTNYGPFSGGGFRYYSTEWGFLIAEKASRISNDRRCALMRKDKQIGIVNPAFRCGTFR